MTSCAGAGTLPPAHEQVYGTAVDVVNAEDVVDVEDVVEIEDVVDAKKADQKLVFRKIKTH